MKLIILTFLFTNHFHSIQSMNSLTVNMLMKNINHYQIQSYSVEHFWYLKEYTEIEIFQICTDTVNLHFFHQILMQTINLPVRKPILTLLIN